jgi:hypothetical protein
MATAGRRHVGKGKISSIALGLAMALASYGYVLHIVNFHCCKYAHDGIFVAGPQHWAVTTTASTTTYGRKETADVPMFANDGLEWITPKPTAARRVKYEDNWLMRWKRRHYDPQLGTRCAYAGDRTPFEGGVMCTIPGYVPARGGTSSRCCRACAISREASLFRDWTDVLAGPCIRR